MSMKKCPSCGTENREDFRYCKNCGTALSETAHDDIRFGSVEPKVDPTKSAVYPKSDTDELAAFIVKGGNSYAEKMNIMKLSGRHSSWNWAVFLFGLLLDMPFVWFFYRRMYKKAAAILAVSLILTVSTAFAAFGFMKPIADSMATVIENHKDTVFSQRVAYSVDDDLIFPHGNKYDYNADPEEFAEEFTDELSPHVSQMLFSLLSVFVLGIIRFAFVIVLSIFADDMYRSHCEKKIALLKERSNPTLHDISLAGGVNSAAAVVVAVAYFIAVFIIAGVLFSACLSSLFSTVWTMS